MHFVKDGSHPRTNTGRGGLCRPRVPTICRANRSEDMRIGCLGIRFQQRYRFSSLVMFKIYIVAHLHFLCDSTVTKGLCAILVYNIHTALLLVFMSLFSPKEENVP